MSLPLEQIEAEALELTASERARLARRLIESLDEEFDEDPDEVERAWEAEIRRRLDEYHAGSVQAIPAADVFSQVRRRTR